MLDKSTTNSLQKAFTLKGRAGKRTYWLVAAPIVAAMMGALAYDLLVLGPEYSEVLTKKTSYGTGETTTTISHVTSYGPREASALAGWLVFLPLTVMLTRRVHDIGYPSFYAWIAVFCAFFAPTFSGAITQLAFLVPPTLAVIWSLLTGLPAFIVSILAIVVIFLWGFADSEPGENEYGPNPHEVPS